jgi:hypothetical protein
MKKQSNTCQYDLYSKKIKINNIKNYNKNKISAQIAHECSNLRRPMHRYCKK